MTRGGNNGGSWMAVGSAVGFAFGAAPGNEAERNWSDHEEDKACD